MTKCKDVKKEPRIMWGCEISSFESMLFSKYLDNNLYIPRPNTLTSEERTQLLSNWLIKHREYNKTLN